MRALWIPRLVAVPLTAGQNAAADAVGNGGDRVDGHLVVELRRRIHLEDVRRHWSLARQLHEHALMVFVQGRHSPVQQGTQWHDLHAIAVRPFKIILAPAAQTGTLKDAVGRISGVCRPHLCQGYASAATHVSVVLRHAEKAGPLCVVRGLAEILRDSRKSSMVHKSLTSRPCCRHALRLWQAATQGWRT